MRLIDDAPLQMARDAWLRGGSALPLVRLHLSRDETAEAAAIARAALEQDGCPDAAEIEKLLYEIDAPSPEWLEMLSDFAVNPSLDRWRQMMLFVPPELQYQRLRNSIRRLRKLGIDPNVLFLCACEPGMTPDAIELVENGLVDVSTILQRAEKAGGARATYLGLAATAAYLKNDIVGAIRLLRESAANENDLCSAFPHILFIRTHASDEVNEALDNAGIPRH